MLRALRGCRSARALATKASSARALATKASSASWSPEWAKAGLGADTAAAGATLNRVMFVQCGFGCDQHGDRKLGATKAAVRAVRNAIEFNSIPGMVEIEGGRKNMLIHLKLGVPPDTFVDTDEVAKVFPYGRLLPIEVTAGGLSYGSGSRRERAGRRGRRRARRVRGGVDRVRGGGRGRRAKGVEN